MLLADSDNFKNARESMGGLTSSKAASAIKWNDSSYLENELSNTLKTNNPV